MSELVNIPIIAASVPEYAHPGDAGADLVATASLILAPGQRALVPTGVRLELPPGFAAFVMPRSGLAVRHGVTVLNAPGVIDSGFRGEIQVALINTDRDEAYEIKPGDRVAQLVIMPVTTAQFTAADSMAVSSRGEGGFGSTGISPRSEAIPADVQEGH